jgi:hypothetical protein
MFSESFDNKISVPEEIVKRIDNIINMYETKLTTHLDRVEKK